LGGDDDAGSSSSGGGVISLAAIPKTKTKAAKPEAGLKPEPSA